MSETERTSYLVHVHFTRKDGVQDMRTFRVANAFNSTFAVKSVFGENRGLAELEIFKVDIKLEQYSSVVELE